MRERCIQLRSSHVFETQLQYTMYTVNKFLPSSNNRDVNARILRGDYARMENNNSENCSSNTWLSIRKIIKNTKES